MHAPSAFNDIGSDYRRAARRTAGGIQARGRVVHGRAAHIVESRARVAGSRSWLSGPKSRFFFECLEGVIDDGAIGRAVDELPHAGADGTLSANDMREVAANIGPVFIYAAIVAGKEYASRFGTPQVYSVV